MAGPTKISGRVVADGTLDIVAINATGTPSAATWLKGSGEWSTILESDITSLSSDLAARLQLGGDILGGTATSPVVTGLQGHQISSATPTAGQGLFYDGSQWTPQSSAFSVWLGQCTVVATTNQALTGTPTIDGVATGAGSVILCTAQTSAVQNGPWQLPIGGGAWVRPVWYKAGLVVAYGRLVYVAQGTADTGYLDTTWKMTTGAGPVVDTDATAWVRVLTSVRSGISGIGHLANGFTGADLSATGGTGQYVKQSAVGASLSVGVIATADIPTTTNYRHVTFVFGNGGSTLTTGLVNAVTAIDGPATLVGVYLMSSDSTSGSATVDIVRANAAVPTSGNSIVGGGGTKPSLSSGTYAKDTTFTSWTSTTFVADDVISLNLTSVTSLKYLTVTLVLQVT